MKKAVTLLVLLVYFTVSTGFFVSVHYCMNRVASVKAGVSNDRYCDLCGMETNGHCCRDDVQYFKVKLEHPVVSATAPDFSKSLFTLPELVSPATDLQVSATMISYPVVSPPPEGPPLFLRHRVFRI